jgi:hypothetical protein
MRVKTIDREAKLLIQLGKMGNERNEAQSLLREARDKCYKLRRDRLAITRAYDDVCQKLDKAIDALEYIASLDTSHAACADLRGAVGVATISLEVIE